MPGRIVFDGRLGEGAADIAAEFGAPAQTTARHRPTPDSPLLPLAVLEAARSSLGPIQHLDLSAYEVPQAHFELGGEVGAQVALFLRKKLEAIAGGELAEEIRHARKAQAEIQRRLGSSQIHGAIRHALGEYFRSLEAWAAGACLAGFARSVLGQLRVDGLEVGAGDLAFLLQNEPNGCQTGVLRESPSSVILWHTEEDREYPGLSRFDKLRLASFRVDGPGGPRTITAFVYPDLLPGPAFGWSGSSYAHAVDAFYLRPPGRNSGVAANAVTWVCLYLGGAFATADIARALAPFRDGYALSSISRTPAGLRGDLTEFIADTVLSTSLPETPGGSLFKVNTLSNQAVLAAPGLEDLRPARRRVLERRVVRTARALRALDPSEDRITGFSRLLSSRVGGEFAYANPSVKAHFLCRMTEKQAQIWVGPGPAIREDHFFAGAWSPDG